MNGVAAGAAITVCLSRVLFPEYQIKLSSSVLTCNSEATETCVLQCYAMYYFSSAGNTEPSLHHITLTAAQQTRGQFIKYDTTLHVPLVPARGFSGCSGFLPQSEHMQVTW